MTKLYMVPKTNLFMKLDQPNTTNQPHLKLKNTQLLLKIHTHHLLKNPPMLVMVLPQMLVMVLLLMMVMVPLQNMTMVPMTDMPHPQNMTMVQIQVGKIKLFFKSTAFSFNNLFM